MRREGMPWDDRIWSPKKCSKLADGVNWDTQIWSQTNHLKLTSHGEFQDCGDFAESRKVTVSFLFQSSLKSKFFMRRSLFHFQEVGVNNLSVALGRGGGVKGQTLASTFGTLRFTDDFQNVDFSWRKTYQIWKDLMSLYLNKDTTDNFLNS